MTKKILPLVTLAVMAAVTAAPAIASAQPVWTINGEPVAETTAVTLTAGNTHLTTPATGGEWTCNADSGAGTIGPGGEGHIASLEVRECKGEGTSAGCTTSSFTMTNMSMQLTEASGTIEDEITLEEPTPVLLEGCGFPHDNSLTGSMKGTVGGNVVSIDSGGLLFDGIYETTYVGELELTSEAGEVGVEA